MQKNRRKEILFAITVLISSTVLAQTTNEFSVKQTVDYGLKNSVQVKNALIDIQSQFQTNKELTGAAYPQINASAGITHYMNVPIQPIQDFIKPQIYEILKQNNLIDPNNIPKSFPDLPFSVVQPWTANEAIDISQILFDGQVFIGLKARKAAMGVATKTAEITKEQIKANIYKVYYQLVVGKKQMASVDANIDRFNKLLHDTKEIYKNGFAERLDVDKVQVSLNNLLTEKEKIQNQLDVGNAGLKFLINMPQKEILVLTDTLSEDEIKSNILDTTFKYEDRKEIQLLTVASKLNDYNVRRYELSKWPTLSAFANYTKNSYSQQMDLFTKGSDWLTTSLIGIKLNVPIFSGFAKNARIANAKLAGQKIKNNLEATKQNIEYDVANSRINMKSALITMDNQKQNIDLAEKVYYAAKKKYEQGLGTNQEIYTAQSELKVAQTNYYSALYDAITAKIDWLKAVGKL